MKIEMNLNIPANAEPMAVRVLSWLRVYFKMWHQALMYTLFVWLICDTIFDGSEVLWSQTLEGVQVTITKSARLWDSWNRFLLIVLGACMWSYTRDTFPRWWKTIRRLNYNRVSRIG